MGNFGDPALAYKGKADMYDPLDSLSDRWLQEAGQDFNPAYQVGVTEPLGYFDPAGFCKRGDEKGFRQLRTAEIKAAQQKRNEKQWEFSTVRNSDGNFGDPAPSSWACGPSRRTRRRATSGTPWA